MYRLMPRSVGIPFTWYATVMGTVRGAASAELVRMVRVAAVEGARWMVFDVGALSGVDSRALSALLLASSVCSSRGGWVVLLHAPPFLRTLLSLVGMNESVRVSEDEAEVFSKIQSHVGEVRGSA